MERWADIPGYPGYQASDLGRIRSLDRYIQQRFTHGVKPRFFRGKVLLAKPSAPGHYPKVEIAGRTFSLHVLIALTFLGPVPEGHEVAHGDGVRTHCALSNLRYATPIENSKDKFIHGTVTHGTAVNTARLTEAQVQEIRALEGRLSNREIARRFNTDHSHIKRIHQRRAWARLPGVSVKTEQRV